MELALESSEINDWYKQSMKVVPKLAEITSEGAQNALNTLTDIEALYSNVDEAQKIVSDVGYLNDKSQYIQMLRLLTQFCKRLVDNRSFEDELERANVVEHLRNNFIGKLVFDVAMRKDDNEISLIKNQVIDCFFRWIWNIIQNKMFSWQRDPQKDLASLYWADLVDSDNKWKHFGQNLEVDILEFNTFDQDPFRRACLLSFDVNSKLGKVILDGVVIEIDTLNGISKRVADNSDLRSKFSKDDADKPVYFYDHRFGWVKGRVIASSLIKDQKGGDSDLLTIAVDTSSQFFQLRRLQHEQIVRQLGLDPTSFFGNNSMSFEAVLDARNVYFRVDHPLTNFTDSFNTGIDYDLFLTYKKPSDKFFLPSGLNIGNSFQLFGYTSFKIQIVTFLNKVFAPIPKLEFVDFFVKIVKNNLNEFSKEIAAIVRLVVIHLEPSLFASGNSQLLGLILYINRKIRACENPIANNELIFGHFITLKVFLLRSLPISIAQTSFKTLLLTSLSDLAKSPLFDCKLVSLVHLIFPSVFETLTLQIKPSTTIKDLVSSSSEYFFHRAQFVWEASFRLCYHKQTSQTIENVITIVKNEFIRLMEKFGPTASVNYKPNKLKTQCLIDDLEPVVMLNFDKIVSSLILQNPDASDWEWTAGVLRTFLQYKHSANEGAKIREALEKECSLEKLALLCSNFAESNLDSHVYEQLKDKLGDSNFKTQFCMIINIIFRVLAKFNSFNNSLSSQALVKLFDVLAFYPSKTTRYDNLCTLIKHSDSRKQTIVGQHISDVCIGLVSANDHSRLFLFEIFGQLMINSWSKNRLGDKNSEVCNTDDGILPYSKLIKDVDGERSQCLIGTLESVGTEAAIVAIQKLRLIQWQTALVETPGTIIYNSKSFKMLQGLWDLFILNPNNSYFPVNDQLSIYAKSDQTAQATRIVSKFRIREQQIFQQDFNGCKQFLLSMMIERESALVTKIGSRFFRKFFSIDALNGYLDRNGLKSFHSNCRDFRNATDTELNQFHFILNVK